MTKSFCQKIKKRDDEEIKRFRYFEKGKKNCKGDVSSPIKFFLAKVGKQWKFHPKAY